MNPTIVTFKKLANGKLRISLDKKKGYKQELREAIEKWGVIQGLMEITEYYWCNGWGVHTGDQLGQLSDAPIICENSTNEDDGSITLHGKAWYYPQYMIYSPLEKILENGYVDFDLWDTFESDNFPALSWYSPEDSF